MKKKLNAYQRKGLELVVEQFAKGDHRNDICAHPELDCTKDKHFNKTVCKVLFPKTVKHDCCPCFCYTEVYVKRVLKENL